MGSAWSTEQVLEQPSLGSEENHQKKKFDEDVIEQGDYVSTPVSSRTWQFLPHGSGVKNKKKGAMGFVSTAKENH